MRGIATRTRKEESEMENFGMSKWTGRMMACKLAFWSKPLVRQRLANRVTARLSEIPSDQIRKYPLATKCIAVNKLTHMGLKNSRLWVNAYMPVVR